MGPVAERKIPSGLLLGTEMALGRAVTRQSVRRQGWRVVRERRRVRGIRLRRLRAGVFMEILFLCNFFFWLVSVSM
jgi:hypothetical protein